MLRSTDIYTKCDTKGSLPLARNAYIGLYYIVVYIAVYRLEGVCVYVCTKCVYKEAYMHHKRSHRVNVGTVQLTQEIAVLMNLLGVCRTHHHH